MSSRTLYLTFYVLYLIVLAIGLWFLLSYSGVPEWVWTFFGAAIVIVIIGLLMKEFFLYRTVTTSGVDVTVGYYNFWVILYIILHIIAFILLITGLFFVITHSTVPWWVWVILGLAILFSIVSDLIIEISPGFAFVALVTSLISFALFVTGLIFFIMHSNAPWWVWLIIGLAILFAILAAVFERGTEPNVVVVNDPVIAGPPVVTVPTTVPIVVPI